MRFSVLEMSRAAFGEPGSTGTPSEGGLRAWVGLGDWVWDKRGEGQAADLGMSWCPGPNLMTRLPPCLALV